MRSLVFQAYAWLGGAAFVASLGYFIYFYAIELGRPEPAGTAAAALLTDTLLFTVFAAHHTLLARPWAKAWISRVIPPSLERSTYVWIASVLFFVVCRAWVPLPGVVYAARGFWLWAAAGAQAAGLWLIYRSTRALDALELAGIRQVQRAASGARPPEPELQVDGPYQVVRHPLYLGWVLLVFGAPTLTASRLAFATISTAYVALAIPFEERSLIAVFGATYRLYAARVRWRLIPWVY